MARIPGSEIILEAAEQWKERCLLDGKSIFSEENLWTQENFSILREHYDNVEQKGRRSGEDYWDSVIRNLVPQSQIAKRTLSEVVWLYFLIAPRHSIRPELKLERISNLWKLSGANLSDTLWTSDEVLSAGIASPGKPFYQWIDVEICHFYVVIENWFSFPADKRLDILDDPWRFAEWLYGVDRNNIGKNRSIRSIIMFFLFPESYEPIVSNDHKLQIIEHFAKKWNETISIDKRSDSVRIDQALLEVRKRVREEISDGEVSFYHEPLKSVWKSGNRNSPETRESNKSPKPIQSGDGGSARHRSLNTILYGPPGTGKTYATFRCCVEICDGTAPPDEKEVRDRYRRLVEEGRLEFVTFHQSYGYEEFVEGLRPQTVSTDTDDGSSAGFRLDPEDGVLKRIAERARKVSGSSVMHSDFGQNSVFKMGLGNPVYESDRGIFEECINNDYILLDVAREVNWSDSKFDKFEEILHRWKKKEPDATGKNPNVEFINSFRNRLSVGDFVIVPAPQQRFRAVGRITGPYRHVERDDGSYPHRRDVQWLWSDSEGMPISELYEYRITPQTIYRMSLGSHGLERLRRYAGQAESSEGPQPHVLVIDEINRGNISKVFGEAITLVEEDKRSGAPNEISVTLPYSGKPFTLPSNLYILGTMNTADRSIALLDTALRRRFDFKELAPASGELSIVDGIYLPRVLETMNARLEWLMGRDHLIGHAWLMGARSKADVDRIMRRKIVPMLAEYFHDDWRKVQAVLGGGREFINKEPLGKPQGIEDDAGEPRYRWTPVEPPYADNAYKRLIEGKPEVAESTGESGAS